MVNYLKLILLDAKAIILYHSLMLLTL